MGSVRLPSGAYNDDSRSNRRGPCTSKRASAAWLRAWLSPAAKCRRAVVYSSIMTACQSGSALVTQADPGRAPRDGACTDDVFLARTDRTPLGSGDGDLVGPVDYIHRQNHGDGVEVVGGTN